MIVRDIDGNIVIVCRSKCKNESVYNEKIYNIRLNYINKYNSVVLNPPKDNIKNHTTVLKDVSDD